MFLLVFSGIYFLSVVRCSVVISRSNQDALYVSDYCPKIRGCDEGTHVMCMYYNPNRVMGPVCGNGRNITVTNAFANKILNLLNEIRQKVALGTETGLDGQLLPRGYGILRLEWDNELATFAQIWANQCEMRHDLCRATTRFENPGQMTGIIRYKYPNWEPSNADDILNNIAMPVVLPEKVDRTIDETIKNSYVNKNIVTPDMINSYPAIDVDALLHPAKIYLQIVKGSNTHVGCGISTYISYYSTGKKKHVIYNTVEVVCNFSGEPKLGEKVYETEPPHKEGWTVRCGCPPGYDEDQDCLCVPSNITATTPNPQCESSECAPPVVLLPIFTVEDAPPEKLYQRRLGNDSVLREDSLEIFNVLEAPQSNLFATPQPNFHLLQSPNVVNIQMPYKLNQRISKIESQRLTDAKNHNSNKNVMIAEHRYRIESPAQGVRHVPQNRISLSPRRSVFTRGSKFELPYQTQHSHHTSSTYNNTFRKKFNTIKKDVTPRKDFTNLSNLVTAYMNKKRLEHVKDHQSLKSKFVENLISSIVPKHQKFGFKDFNLTSMNRNSEIRNSYEETDNKLLTLLDNLEQEVKHIELDDNVKEIVDAKIRKIYGNVVGNPDKLTNPKRAEIVDDFKENEVKRSKASKMTIVKDQRVLNTPIPGFEMTRPLKRNQDALVGYEKPVYDHYRRKFTVFDKNNRDVERLSSDFGKNNLRYSKNDKFEDEMKEDYYKSNNDNQGRRKKFDKLETDNYYLAEAEDLLGMERRKYYQEKLDKLERKLQSRRNYRRDAKDANRYSRPVQMISRSSLDKPRSTDPVQPFYIPDRAKYLHGF